MSDEYKMQSKISTLNSLILLSQAGDELAEKGETLGHKKDICMCTGVHTHL